MKLVADQKQESRITPAVRALLVSFLLHASIAGSWALATPLFGVPDEVSHMIRAAGAARGDISGDIEPSTGRRAYRAPAILDQGPGNGGVCFAAKVWESPNCAPLSSARHETRYVSSAHGYPPLYYIVVGWPTLLDKGPAGLYGMRLVSAALFAGLLALAIATLGIRGPRTLAHGALWLSITPLAWFIGGSVNPSALAIGAALAAWCGGYRLMTGTDEASAARYAWRFGLPLCLFLFARRDSVFWGAAIVLTLAVMLNRSRLATLARSRHVLGWGSAAVLCALVASRTGASTAARVARAGSNSGSAYGALRDMVWYLRQMVGVLGWLDTSLPSGAYTVMFVLAGGLVVVALAKAPWPQRRAIAMAIGLTVAMIVYVGAQRHPYFQGRYGLPLAVGIVMLAGMSLETASLRAPIARPSLAFVLVVASAVHAAAYVAQFRRYGFPGESTWWVFSGSVWQPPPLPFTILLASHVVLLGAATAWWSGRRIAARNTVPVIDHVPRATPLER